MEDDGKRTTRTRNVEYFAKKESPARGHLVQVRSRDDTYCTERMMKQGFIALKSGDWEEYKSIFGVDVKATEWAFN